MKLSSASHQQPNHSHNCYMNMVCVSGHARGAPLMTNHISIKVEDDEQYEHLQEIRERYGVTWKGLLVQGTFHLEDQDRTLEEDDES